MMRQDAVTIKAPRLPVTPASAPSAPAPLKTRSSANANATLLLPSALYDVEMPPPPPHAAHAALTPMRPPSTSPPPSLMDARSTVSASSAARHDAFDLLPLDEE